MRVAAWLVVPSVVAHSLLSGPLSLFLHDATLVVRIVSMRLGCLRIGVLDRNSYHCLFLNIIN